MAVGSTEEYLLDYFQILFRSDHNSYGTYTDNICILQALNYSLLEIRTTYLLFFTLLKWCFLLSGFMHEYKYVFN
jgi:hypothetical protein